MHCKACDILLSDREANRKFSNHKEIADPEQRYIMLCDHCIEDTDLLIVENPLDNDDVVIFDEEG